MGSLLNASKTGFICRLCSNIYKNVVHIYGRIGRQINLAKKINNYLPVSINPSDTLPKTVCLKCLSQLVNTYKLVRQLANAKRRLLQESQTQSVQRLSSKRTTSTGLLPSRNNTENTNEELSINSTDSSNMETN